MILLLIFLPFPMQSAVRRLFGDSAGRRHGEIQINSPPSSGRSAVPRKASDVFFFIILFFIFKGPRGLHSLCHIQGSLQLLEGNNSHKLQRKQTVGRRGRQSTAGAPGCSMPKARAPHSVLAAPGVPPKRWGSQTSMSQSCS